MGRSSQYFIFVHVTILKADFLNEKRTIMIIQNFLCSSKIEMHMES